jgi:WD40 repeat protein
MTETLSSSDDIESGAIPGCPYKGLHAYTEADGEFFFGRDSDRDLVIANLMAGRLTVLYGPSGVGKSSLLQAGVMRHLRKMPQSAFSYLAIPDAIIVYQSSWRNDSLSELRHALAQAVPAHDGIEDIFRAQRPLSELLHELTERLNSYVYLLLDQFEEQALYQPGEQGEPLLEELGQIITTPGLRASVLLGIREDALSKLDRLEAYVPGLYDNNLPLDNLSRAEAREAIEGPLNHYNQLVPPARHVTIEPDLIDELLPQLQTGTVSVDDIGQGGVNASSEDSIETPFLQLVMTSLWDEEANRGSLVLRRATLASLGGAARIVRTHLDAVMSDLTEQQQDIAAKIFRYLVTPSGTKYSYAAENLADLAVVDSAQVSEVLEKLAASRELVLRAVPPPLDSPESLRYEIFHDVMVPAVLDWRRRYVAERQRIASEQALLLKSRQAEEELRKTRKRVRLYALLSAALGLLLIMTTVTIALALNGRSVARAALLTQYHEQLARYEAKLDSNPAASLRAALQAWDKLRTAEAKGAVRTALQAEALEAEAQAAVRTALEADTQRLLILAGHGDFTTSEFAPDGLTLLTAGSDGTSKLFDATTGKLVRAFKPGGTEPPSALRQASVSSDGTMVLTTATDGTIRLYDLATGRDLGLLTRAPRAMWGTRSGRPVVLTFGNFSAASLWDPQGLSKIREYGHKTVEASLSPDGRHVLTVDVVLKGKKAITVWDAESGLKERTSVPVGLLASKAQFVATGWDKVVFRANDTPNSWQVTLWDWGKGSNALLQTDSRSRLAGPIAVSTDGQFFAAAVDKHVTVFDAEQGKSIGDVPDQPDRINDLDLSVDGSWLATAGDDGQAFVWNAHRFNNQPIAALLGHDRPISDVRFDPSSPWRITTASGDGTARTWQLASHTDLTPGSHRMLDADINGQLLVAAEDTGDLRVYKRRAGDRSDQWAQVAHTSLRGGGLGSASFTRDGRTVVSAGLGDTAPSVWVWQSSNPPRRLTSSNRILTALAVSPDGQRVAAGDGSNRATVWDLGSGKIAARFELGADGYQVTGMTYVPHSPLVAAASADGTVRLFDPAKPDQPSRTLGNVGDPAIKALDVSADGTYVATASEDRSVRVWRISDGTLQQTIDGPPSTNTDVAFSPDGRLMALATADAAVHIWEWQTKQKLAVLRRHVDVINSVQFSPGGNNIITASDDATVAIFPCTTCQPFDQLVETAKQQDRSRR